MSYGLLTGTDVALLEAALRGVLARLSADAPVHVLEIGVCHGDTARGLAEFCSREGHPIAYVGIDNQRDKQVDIPFPGASLLLGESTELYPEAPSILDFLIIDGCHCVNHVMLDFLNYAPRVALGGCVMFHDMSPLAQEKCDYQGHGPRAHPDFGTATVAALYRLGLYPQRQWAEWEPEQIGWEQGVDWGGVAIFRRHSA